MNWLASNCEAKRLEATVTLEYGDERIAEAIAKAVSPDNFKTPVGLSVRTVRENNCVVTEIRAEGKMATFIATIDDLLSSVSTAEKALRILRE